MTSPFHPFKPAVPGHFPYTDLLLHDMGEGLADTLPLDGVLAPVANPTSLGIGLTAGVSGERAICTTGAPAPSKKPLCGMGAKRSRAASLQAVAKKQQAW